MALQGVEIEVHDIDIQTDQVGAYEIEKKLSEYVITPVHYIPSEKIRSHLGKLIMDGVNVEIMGAVQKYIDDQTWEEPVDVKRYRRWVESNGLRIPVLSLDYEVQAYLRLGRIEKAEMLKRWIQNHKDSDS
jgi:hypothetical protein